MKKKAILIICSSIIIFLLAIFLGYKLVNLKENENSIETNSKSVEQNNTVENVNNNLQKENVTNNIMQNNAVENIIDSEAIDNQTIQTNLSNEEKAINIVENNWGKDDTVSFVLDNINSSGDYVICVRDKQTTKALYWYIVNINTGAFTIQ